MSFKDFFSLKPFGTLNHLAEEHCGAGDSVLDLATEKSPSREALLVALINSVPGNTNQQPIYLL